MEFPEGIFARMSRAEKKRDVTKAMRCEASFRSSCIEIFCFSRIASARRDFFLTKSANWEEKMCEIIIKNQLKIIMSVERTSHRDSSPSRDAAERNNRRIFVSI